MRKLLVAFTCFFIYDLSSAQLRMTANPQATTFYNKAMVSARPAVQAAVNRSAKVFAGKNIFENDLRAGLKKDPACINMSAADIEGLMLLVMMQINNDAEKDLKEQMAEMKANAEKKKQRRELLAKKDSLHRTTTLQMQNTTVKKDELNDMSDTDQLQLQMLMDRRAKMEEMISNLMKKINDTQNQIIANLK